MIACVLVLGVGTLGCALTRPSVDPWTTTYDGSPNDVWTAIHNALIDLDFEVVSENRDEGVIRATRAGGSDTRGAVLSIDQMMPNQTVKVYVRVAAAPGEPTLSFDEREALAQEFLALVNAALYK